MGHGQAHRNQTVRTVPQDAGVDRILQQGAGLAWCTLSTDDYAFLHRGNPALRLFKALSESELDDRRGQQHVYLGIDDIDGLYAELKPELEKLPQGRVRPPSNTEYDQREVHVTNLDAPLISFGQKTEIERSARGYGMTTLTRPASMSISGTKWSSNGTNSVRRLPARRISRRSPAPKF